MFKTKPEPHTHMHALARACTPTRARARTRQPARDCGEHLNHALVPSVFQLSVIFQSDTAVYKQHSLFL